jgi:hypothetical protein
MVVVVLSVQMSAAKVHKCEVPSIFFNMANVSSAVRE